MCSSSSVSAALRNTAERFGGGIYNYNKSTADLYNCIIAQNIGNSAANDITNAGSISGYNSLSSLSKWTAGSNNLKYNTAKTLFTDAGSGDFTLAAGSQAIDKGYDAYAIDAEGNPLTVDLGGDNRFVDIVDMGAYEYQKANANSLRDAAFANGADDLFDGYDF